MEKNEIVNSSHNRIIYTKTNFDTKNLVAENDFIIVNNNKIVCPLQIINGEVQPTLKLQSNQFIESHTVGLRESIPKQMRYCVTPSEITIDLHTDSFKNIELLDDEHGKYLVQYPIEDSNISEDGIVFKKNFPISYKKLYQNTTKYFKETEEKIYLNFKKGFTFSIINSEIKLLYIFIEDIKNRKVAELYSQKDMLMCNRLIKYWPELQLSVEHVDDRYFLISNSELDDIFESYLPDSIYYMYHYMKSNIIKTSIPYSLY